MNREQIKDFENFRRCAEEAPDGAYEQAKQLNQLIGDTCDRFIRELREAGLLADNCDRIFEIEVALYNYTKASNPEACVFPTAEGFGEAMEGPARNRVLKQTAENIQFFAKLN